VELHQRHHPRAAGAPALFFNSSALVKRAVPRPSGTVPGGLAGMAELAPLFPGGPGGGKPLLLHASFLVFPTTARERALKLCVFELLAMFHPFVRHPRDLVLLRPPCAALRAFPPPLVVRPGAPPAELAPARLNWVVALLSYESSSFSRFFRGVFV
jgi:hypothetical protein